MDDKERYQKYLCSPEWWAKRNAVLERSNGMCERCRINDAVHVHHLTYARKYNEDLADLQAVCKSCHNSIHNAKVSREPSSNIGLRIKKLHEIKSQLLAKAEGQNIPNTHRSLQDLIRKLFEDLDQCPQGESAEWFVVSKLEKIAFDLMV